MLTKMSKLSSPQNENIYRYIFNTLSSDEDNSIDNTIKQHNTYNIDSTRSHIHSSLRNDQSLHNTPNHHSIPTAVTRLMHQMLGIEEEEEK